MDEDLLVTNAFYPIASVISTESSDISNIKYNYKRDTQLPYLREKLGPYPTIEAKQTKKYDVKTTENFKHYLRKKNILKDEVEFFLSKKNPLLGSYKPSSSSSSQNVDEQNASSMPSFDRPGQATLKRELSGGELLKEANDDDNIMDQQGKRLTNDTVTYINIDSTKRDFNDYPLSYDYTITLPKPIKNVKMIEIKQSEFHYSNLPANFVNPINNSLTPYKYILMYINLLGNVLNAGTVDSKNTSQTQSFFTKIQLDGTVGSTLYNKHLLYTSVYQNSIPEIYGLQISFQNGDGSQYFMNEHSFTISIISYLDTTNFTDMSTRRGATDITTFLKVLQ